MGRDWEAEGLLDGLEGKAREQRASLLAELEALGCEAQEIGQAAADGRLSLLLVERTLGGAPRYDANAVAAQSGLDLGTLVRLQQAMGRAVPQPDEVVYDDADVEAAQQLGRLRDGGIPEDGLLEITRVLARSLRQGADAIRGVFERSFVEAGMPEEQFAQRNAALAGEMMGVAGPLLTYVLSVHLREGIRAEAVGAAQRAARGQLAGARPVAVGFVDLVGYTRLGQRVEADEIGEVAQRLEVLATEVVGAPARVVKTLGDAVMIVGPDATQLVDAVVELVGRVAEEGDRFPEAHAGIAAGPALARGGDWYGHPVNLASRITGVARPGSVLCAEQVREVTGDTRFRWSAAGSRRLKGMRGSERLVRVRRREVGEESQSG